VKPFRPFLPTVLPALFFFAAAHAGGAATDAPAPTPWWQDLQGEVLAELKCAEADDILHTLPAPWQLRKGTFKIQKAVSLKAPDSGALMDSLLGEEPAKPAPHSDRPSHVFLEITESLELAAGDASWRDYAVDAEIMLGSEREVALSVANAPDGRAGYSIAIKGASDKTLIYLRCSAPKDGEPAAADNARETATWIPYRLRLDLKRVAASSDALYSESGPSLEEQKRRYEALLSAESTPDQYWDSRWLRLRIEVTRRQARMWVEGTLAGSLDFPARSGGGIALSLNEKDQLRALMVRRIPDQTAGFLPLDLAGKFNNNGLGEGGDLGDGTALDAAALPPAGRYIAVRNIPFYWNCSAGKSNNIDMTQATVRGGGRLFFYDANDGDRKRVMLRVPRRQYNELALLVAADNRSAATNELTVRMLKTYRCHYHDASGQIPGVNATGAVAHAVSLPAGSLLSRGKPDQREGCLWLARIPLDPGAFQDFLGDDSEKFLDLDLMDLDGKGGVHIFAATLVESPVEMKVASDEIGHVFVQPQAPAFHCILRNVTPDARTGRIEIAAADYYGTTNLYRSAYAVPAATTVTNTILMPDKARGIHYLDARLLGAAGEPLVRRRTTYALLPPDTRQADRDSPFGMWSFGSGHYGGGTNAGAVLMSKIGVRWSHHAAPGLKLYHGYGGRMPGDEAEEAWVAAQAQYLDIGHWTVFAETAIGGRHYDYFPTELLEHPHPMALTPDEEAAFQRLWEGAITYSDLTRKYFPAKPLVFGNGYPQFIWTFLSRGYPRRYLDGFALDFMGDGMYMFYYLREAAKYYGYGDVPLFISEGFYIGSERGYYPSRESEDRQLEIYLRGFLVGFAIGLERYIGACEIWDNGGGYYYTGYGPVGVCHRAPELNPKPSYCSYGTMSLLLDKARFHSLVPAGTLCVYMLRFDGPRGPVYAVWTADGSRRALRFTAAAGQSPKRTDSQCNSFPLESKDGQFGMDISPTPMWIENAGVISAIEPGEPVYDSAPATNAVALCSPAADMAGWSFETNAYAAMQALDYNRPVKPGAFQIAAAEGRKPGEKALALTVVDEPAASPYRLRYSLLRPKDKIAVPAATAKLGAWVYGNGTAILDLEVRDARGVAWHTIRGPRGYGFGMGYNFEPHAFEGWRYVEYPFEGWRRPWRNESGASKMEFPLKLTGLIVEQYGQVVYVNRLMPAYDKTWRIGDIVCE
jgi:hypothetical protein